MRGMGKQAHGRGVHQQVLQLDVREFGRHDAAGYAAPEARSGQHIGLVDGGHAPLPPARQLRGKAHDPLHFRAAVGAQIAGLVLAFELVAEIDAAGELAHHDQVHARELFRPKRRGVGSARQRPDGAQIGVHAEQRAQIQQALFRAQCRIGRRRSRQAHGAQQHRVGVQAKVARGSREGGAQFGQRAAAERRLPGFNIERVPGRRGPQHAQPRAHDLRPDTVAGQYGNEGCQWEASQALILSRC